MRCLKALNEVRSCMENPFDNFGLPPMLGKKTIQYSIICKLVMLLTTVVEPVHLDVDAKSADSWYKAK